MNASRGLVGAAFGVLVLCVATFAIADADESLELGARALRAERWEQAAGRFREAIEADGNCLEAHRGLGEALLGAGKQDEAVLAFRQAVWRARGIEHVTGDAADAVRAAAKRLEKMDPRGQALEAMLDAHASALAKLAGRYKTKDPDLCSRAVDVALTLRPDHAAAQRVKTQLQSRGTDVEKMFDGVQVRDWTGGKSKWWSVVDGVIVGDAGMDIASYIRTEQKVEGDFDVVVEMRMTKGCSGGSPYFAMMGAWTAEKCHSRFGVLVGAVVWTEYHSADDQERVFSRPVDNIRGRYDPSKWNTYELRFRGQEITAVLNGRKLHKTRRMADRAGGFVGLLAQECRVEIRRVDVLHR